MPAPRPRVSWAGCSPGLLTSEHANGPRLLRSEATGFSHPTLNNVTARVRLDSIPECLEA